MVKLKNRFPESFFNEEVRNGFTITRKRKEIWAIELDMLIELDKICDALGINYFLDSGTLLGAVRDGHFIPWDDDIDVVMLRKDYDILTQQAPSMFEKPLLFQNPYTDPGYLRGHSQIRNSETTAILPRELNNEKFNQGIFIDIFPLDGVDETSIDNQLYIINKKYRFCHYLNHPERIRKFKSKLRYYYLKAKYKNYQEIYNEIEEILRRNDNTQYVSLLFYYKKKDRKYWLERKWYDNSIDIMFEGYAFPIPAEYDLVLKACYGDDYLTPRQLAADHNIEGDIIFDTCRSYLDYIG